MTLIELYLILLSFVISRHLFAEAVIASLFKGEKWVNFFL